MMIEEEEEEEDLLDLILKLELDEEVQQPEIGNIIMLHSLEENK